MLAIAIFAAWAVKRREWRERKNAKIAAWKERRHQSKQDRKDGKNLRKGDDYDEEKGGKEGKETWELSDLEKIIGRSFSQKLHFSSLYSKSAC